MISFNHPVYGKCYTPYYIGAAFDFIKPEIYNALGEQMDIFFLRDASSAHSPGARSKKVKDRYFLWDRFNFGLETHFYTDMCIAETMWGGAQNQRNYAILNEPKSVIAHSYNLLYENKDLSKKFEKILTHDEKLLDTLPNAMLYNSCAVAYCYKGDDPLRWSADKYLHKTRLISMVISGKELTPLHLKRNALAEKLYKRGGVDLYGNAVRNPIVHKSLALDTYCYHIAMENEQNKYYFTEKIIDCFISMSVPIYLGATKIGDFFNKDGIIEISEKDLENFDTILAQCTPEDYMNRLEAIKDNYCRSLRYLNGNNRLYEELFLKN